MLTRAGGGVLALIKFCRAINPPKVVVESAHEAIRIVALGAAALAHSASRMASASFGGTTPGLAQLLGPFKGAGWTVEKDAELYLERPNFERNVVQSELLNTFVSSISTIVWPWPVIPELKRGFKL